MSNQTDTPETAPQAVPVQPVSPEAAPTVMDIPPEVKLLGYLRSASALADEALELALHIPVHPELAQRFAAASKALHSATLLMVRAAE